MQKKLLSLSALASLILLSCSSTPRDPKPLNYFNTYHEIRNNPSRNYKLGDIFTDLNNDDYKDKINVGPDRITYRRGKHGDYDPEVTLLKFKKGEFCTDFSFDSNKDIRVKTTQGNYIFEQKKISIAKYIS